MGNARTSVASRHRAPDFFMRRSVRFHLTTGGAVASAGILALSLVAAPPDVNDARTEARAVQLAAFALPPAASPAALLEKYISNQARTVVPATPVVGSGAADITTAVAASPLTFDSAMAPVMNRQQVNNAALAATNTAFDLGAILGRLIDNPIVGPVVLVGTLLFGFLVVLPVEFFIETVYEAIAKVFGLPPTLPLPGTVSATVEANATTAPTLTSGRPLSDSASVGTATGGPVDAAPATETGKADVSPPVMSTGTTTRTKQRSTDTATSTKDVTETAKTDEASTGPTAAGAPEPLASASTSGPAKPTVRPARPRPVVRGSLGVGEQLRDLPHRGNGGHPTTPIAAGRGAATAGPSSVASSSAASSSTRSSSSGGGTSGGHAGSS